jgi:hypothetical protein
MANIRKAGFIGEKQDEKNRTEKVFRLTGKGETAFRFYADPIANSHVNMVLEGS